MLLQGISRRLSDVTEWKNELVPLVRQMPALYASFMASALPTGGLVGRDSELTLLHDLLREAAHGRGHAVLVEGEPGIGKTALGRSVATAARDVDCEVFWGTGDELGQELPLLPFLDALRVRQPSASARRASVIQLLRGETPADRGADVPRALAEQLLALVTEQCTVSPTVIVIDDLQWADADSVALWGRLARLAEQMPLLLIGMMRPIPKREDLLALRRLVDGRSRIKLPALSETAVTHLITALAGAIPGRELRCLAAGAAGNPLYLTELVAALNRSNSLMISESGMAELIRNTAPDSLSAAIADRLGFVTGQVRDVIRAAALLGVEFAVSDLAAVLNRSISDLLPAIDEACAAGILVECGEFLGFRHPIIREALYGEMVSSVRAAWHREAGRALAIAGAAVDRVARQLLRAVNLTDGISAPKEEVPIDQWILEWLESNADSLVSHAPSVAAELLTWAAANTTVGSARHGLLACSLADALYRIGDRAHAEEVASCALDHVQEPDVLVDLLRTLAQCRALAGLSEESLATLDQALAMPGLTPRHRARLLVPAARMHFNLGEVEAARSVASDALAAASAAGDNWAAAWALHVLALTAGVRGQMSDALPLFDRALSVTQADASLTDLRMLLQINKAVTLGYVDQYEHALHVAGQARQLANQVGTVIRQAQAHGAVGQLLYETGKWDAALAELSIVPQELKEPGAICGELGITAIIRFHRGETEEANRCLSASIPYSKKIGQRLLAPLALARSLQHENSGAFNEALAALTAGFGDDTEELDGIEEIFADAVRLATRSDNLTIAKFIADNSAKLAEGSPIPHRQANALYCRGMIDHDPHKLMAAAARYEDASRPLLQAKALEAAAVEFVDSGDRIQGKDAFSRAVEVYESLGATADIQRLLALFRGYGIRRGPRSKHRQAQSGWDSLTPMERKIAGFVEEGLSNPDIAARLTLSRRTVGTHVSHILKKLGVNSRTDIAREAALRSLAAR
jgi:DNA-binding CsgD family transcriptional regulator